MILTKLEDQSTLNILSDIT